MTALDRLRPPVPGEPAHRQIEDLRDLIAAGVLAPGDRIPAERDLSATLGVSPMTLRQALDGLVRRGLLVRAGGRGTFVGPRRVAHDLRVLRTYPEELAGQGVAHATVLLACTREPVGSDVGVELGLAAGDPVLRIERLRSADGEPLVLETSWISAARFPALDGAALGDSLWDALAARGARVVHVEERLEPGLARPTEAGLLGIAPGAPVMRVERVAHAAGGEAVEFALAAFRGDRTRFIVEAAVPDTGRQAPG